MAQNEAPADADADLVEDGDDVVSLGDDLKENTTKGVHLESELG